MGAQTGRDLHKGFRDPRRVPAAELVRFLEEADRLPRVRPIQRAMRRALGLRPGMRLLDAGCGIGLETARLAWEHPEMHVTGLDRNAEMLEMARRRVDPPPANLRWVEGDLTALDLPEASFDAIRTDRVLMYLPEPDFPRVLGDLVRLLSKGGRLALFELDYGGTMLAPGAAGPGVVERAEKALLESLPQPLAGRRIPGLLADTELRDVAAEPFSFTVSEPVWQRIVADTLKSAGEADAELSAWLGEQGAAASRGEFVAAFAGVLTTGVR
jgi:ubiquinone/menaquinone biosynthesis C-methylase UbiE